MLPSWCLPWPLSLQDSHKSSHCAYFICFRDCLLHSAFPTSCRSFKLCFSISLSLFPFPHPAQQDRIAPAPCSWQHRTLHYSAAPPHTSVLTEVVLYSVGCKHENVVFLFRHRFEQCSVDSFLCSIRSEIVAHPLSVIKIWTNLTRGSRVTPCLVNPGLCETWPVMEKGSGHALLLALLMGSLS